MDLGLKGRVALVCGGTRGIGRAVANQLKTEGAEVAVNARSNAPFPADVSVPEQAVGLVQRVAKEFGRLDILFCNAEAHPPRHSRISPPRRGSAPSSSTCFPRSIWLAPPCPSCSRRAGA